MVVVAIVVAIISVTLISVVIFIAVSYCQLYKKKGKFTEFVCMSMTLYFKCISLTPIARSKVSVNTERYLHDQHDMARDFQGHKFHAGVNCTKCEHFVCAARIHVNNNIVLKTIFDNHIP